jgi:catechol 2,3-dioxygenase-like lactoylglutathione lyase family enzyme
LCCISLKTKGFSRETEALIWIGGGETLSELLTGINSRFSLASTLLFHRESSPQPLLLRPHMTKQSTLIPELQVLDYDKSVDFYTKLAGFAVVYDRLEENFAMLEINGARLMIEGVVTKSRSWLVGQMERPFGRGMHLQIEVQDVHCLYQNFRKEGYRIFFDLEEKWYRANDQEVGHKQFLVQDPDGYLLRFFEKIGTRSFS